MVMTLMICNCRKNIQDRVPPLCLSVNEHATSNKTNIVLFTVTKY